MSQIMHMRIKIGTYAPRLHAAALNQMPDAYLHADTDQYTASGESRFFIEGVSRFFADIHCGQADESRRYADCQGGQLYIRVDYGKPDADGKSIDTGCNALYKEQRKRQIPSVCGFFSANQRNRLLFENY